MTAVPKHRKASKRAGRPRPAKPAAQQTPAIDSTEVPAWLQRSLVYKRLPPAVRAQLDEAILLRPAEHATLEAIAKRFQLAERYQISLPVLSAYARKLEEFVRPAMTSQVIAALLGCLPNRYRRQLVAGTQVLLLSRVVQALTADKNKALPVADLGKLASILSAFAGRNAGGGRRARPRDTQASKGGQTPEHSVAADPTKLAEAVSMLYGISWPPASPSPEQPTKPAPHANDEAAPP